MKFKTGIVVGVGVGYWLATKIDPETRRRFETKVNERVNQWRDDPRVQEVVDSVSTVATEVVDKIDAKLTEGADAVADTADDLADDLADDGARP